MKKKPEIEFVFLTDLLVNDTRILLNGITPKNNTMNLILDFDIKKVIGVVTFYVDKRKVKARAIIDLPPGYYESLYPAAGIVYKISDTWTSSKGVINIKKLEIATVSLCTSPNQDSSIKKIKEQLKK